MKKYLSAILALVSVLSLTACAENAQTSTPNESTTSAAQSSANSETSQTSTPSESTTSTTQSSADSGISQTSAPNESTVSSDNILNSARLFDSMYGNNDKAMFSPLSLNMCLGMLETGAAGSSKAALDAYLGTDDYAKFAADYLEHAKSFTREVNVTDSEKYKDVFEIANSLWASEQIPLGDEYKSRVSEYFGAKVENVNFLENIEAAAKINGWVKEKTHEMIPSVVDPELLGEKTAAVLVNTVYFESAWSDKWSVPSEKETFTNADGSTAEVELMRNGGYGYFENDNATAFSCFYKNGMRFIGILPKSEGDFTLESLDIGSLLQTETREYNVFARMPKLDFESSFPLTDALTEAGLSDIFDPGKADFTPMQSSDAQQFYISEVLQKTKLELDDEGTRAAAATVAVANVADAEVTEREEKEVFLNRPFAFLIYDSEQEQIVFMGKVTKI